MRFDLCSVPVHSFHILFQFNAKPSSTTIIGMIDGRVKYEHLYF